MAVRTMPDLDPAALLWLRAASDPHVPKRHGSGACEGTTSADLANLGDWRGELKFVRGRRTHECAAFPAALAHLQRLP